MRIAGRFVRLSLMDQLAHRKSFIIAVVTKILRAATMIVFFEAIYLRVPSIGTWSRLDALVLVACFLTFESIAVITFHRNLAYYFPSYLQKGTLDLRLTQPLPLLPHVAFRVIDLMDLTAAIPVTGVWWYLATHGALHPSIGELTAFLMTFLLGLIFLFCLGTIVAAASFWSLAPTGYGRLFEHLFRTGRYPTDALGGAQRFALTSLIPFALVGTIPAQVLLGRTGPMTILWSLILVIVFALIARTLWQRGLRRYSSASS